MFRTPFGSIQLFGKDLEGPCRKQPVMDEEQNMTDNFLRFWFGDQALQHYKEQRQAGHPCCGQARTKVWVHRLRLRGFLPSEMKVQIEGDKILVNARHETSDGENVDVYEAKRSVAIPENVNKDKISSRFAMNNVLVLYAPYIEMKKETYSREVKVQETDAEKENTEVEKEQQIKIENSVEIYNDDDSLSVHSAVQEDLKNVEKDFEIVEKEGDGSKHSDENSSETTHTEEDSVEFENQADADETEESVLDQQTYPGNELTATDDSEQKDFHLEIDINRFGTDNVQVIQKDGSLIVKAEQKKEENGVEITEYYVSKHNLPENVDTGSLKCVTEGNGKLSFRGSMKNCIVDEQ